MSDELDLAAERSQLAVDSAVAAIRAKAHIEPGRPGECGWCSERTGRLVGGACAPCREKYQLP